MTQNREYRGLWDAVEELKRRVDDFEGRKAAEVAPTKYVASALSNRKTFHRKECKFARNLQDVHTFSSHDDAVAAGLVPCKSCRA